MSNGLAKRIDALERQQELASTEWRPGMLPLPGDEFPSFRILDATGEWVEIGIDAFI